MPIVDFGDEQLAPSIDPQRLLRSYKYVLDSSCASVLLRHAQPWLWPCSWFNEIVYATPCLLATSVAYC